MSQFALCLVEFLLFLGIPYLRALQRLIDSAITQLEIAKAQVVAQLAFGDNAVNTVVNKIAIMQLLADEVRNVLGTMPISTFRDCTAAGEMLGTIKSAFDPLFDKFDAATAESNRLRALQNAKSSLSDSIDEDIQYLRDLNAQIDVAIAELLRREASQI